jgi:hypothetical protein
VAGAGLEGDHAGSGTRQVTLLEREAWEAACRDLYQDLDAGARRANIVVEGVSLAVAIKHRLQIGDCIIQVIGRSPPLQADGRRRAGIAKRAVSEPPRRGVRQDRARRRDQSW